MQDSPGATGSFAGSSTEDGTITEQVKTQTQQAVQQTQDKAGQVAGQAADRAQSMLETQKGRGSDTVNTVAHALRQTGQDLRDQNQGAIAQAADRAADQLERVSGYLNNRSVGDIVGEVEDVARRNPALFLGGAFGLGVIAARFLKSSSSNVGSGAQGGTYRYPNVQHRYENVQGAPYVERRYAPGLTTAQGPGSEATDVDYGSTGTGYGTGMSDYTNPVSAAGTFDEDLGATDTDLRPTGNAYRSSNAEVRSGDGA